MLKVFLRRRVEKLLEVFRRRRVEVLLKSFLRRRIGSIRRWAFVRWWRRLIRAASCIVRLW